MQTKHTSQSSVLLCPADFPSPHSPLSDWHAMEQEGWDVRSRATMVFTVTDHCTGPYKCHSAWWEEGTCGDGKLKQDHPGDNVFHSRCTVTTCSFKSNPTIPHPNSGVRDGDWTANVWRSNMPSHSQERFCNLVIYSMGVGWGRTCGGGVTSQARLLERSTVPNHIGVAQPSCGQPDPG